MLFIVKLKNTNKNQGNFVKYHEFLLKIIFCFQTFSLLFEYRPLNFKAKRLLPDNYVKERRCHGYC